MRIEGDEWYFTKEDIQEMLQNISKALNENKEHVDKLIKELNKEE